MKRWISLFVVVLVAAACLGVAAYACPMCKDSISDSDAERAMALPSGFNYSVYYMLGGLFFAIAMVSTTIVRAVNRTPVKLPPNSDQPHGFDVEK
jgi:hypothetical protein